MFFSPIGNSSPYLDKLVGYYKFDSNGNDFSGNGHNGTIEGTPVFSAGKVGNAIDFINNTDTNYVDVPHTTDFNFADATNTYPFSMCMWVKFHAFSSTANFILNKRTTTSAGDEWQIIYIFGRLYFYKFQYNNNSIFQVIASSINPFSVNTWYHLAYTDDGTASIGSGKLYINGLENVDINSNQNGTFTNINYGNSISRFGAASWSSISALKHKGLIDETYIWKDRCLTPSEVLDIYNKGILGQILI